MTRDEFYALMDGLTVNWVAHCRARDEIVWEALEHILGVRTDARQKLMEEVMHRYLVLDHTPFMNWLQHGINGYEPQPGSTTK